MIVKNPNSALRAMVWEVFLTPVSKLCHDPPDDIPCSLPPIWCGVGACEECLVWWLVMEKGWIELALRLHVLLVTLCPHTVAVHSLVYSEASQHPWSLCSDIWSAPSTQVWGSKDMYFHSWHLPNCRNMPDTQHLWAEQKESIICRSAQWSNAIYSDSNAEHIIFSWWQSSLIHSFFPWMPHMPRNSWQANWTAVWHQK